MPTYNVKKVATSTTDIGGLKSSRYEKLQVSYGKIPASSYELLDTIVFGAIPSKEIIRATIIAHASPDVSLVVYPANVSNEQPYTLSSVTSPVDISYVIEYVRGTGQVGNEAYSVNTYGAGQALESGEGALFSVIIGDISSLSTAQVASLSTSQVAALNTSQVKKLTTKQAASLTTKQVQAFTTTQIPALETQDFAAFTTVELQALETVDVKALTSSQLKALSTTQLNALTTSQTAVLTAKQKSGLTTTQLAALQ